MSSAFDIVQKQLGFTVPDAYRRMYDAGILGDDPDRSLTLSDTEWFDPESMVKYKADRFRPIGLIPFAMTGTGDVWAWALRWAEGDRVPVVRKGHDTNDMEGLAPDFPGCVYRLLLEEMYDTMLPQIRECPPNEIEPIHRQNVQRVSAYLPSPWVATLNDLAARPVRETRKSVGVMDQAELLGILQRDLAFPYLNQTVVVE